MLWWDTGARPNVAGHRFAGCSAAPAQRFYSTPLRAHCPYERPGSHGDEGTIGRTISDLGVAQREALDDEFSVRGG